MKHKFNLSSKVTEKCKDFSKKASEKQRPYRSGGSQVRDKETIYKDTLRGKIAEAVVKEFLKQPPFEVEITLDFGVYERGVWDETDFELGGKDFQVKGVKHFSSWLLVESKDIERGDVYDYYILTAVEKNMKGGRILGYASHDEIVSDKNSQYLKKGDSIPGTSTKLDASNYARHKDQLHNTDKKWKDLILPLL